MYLALCLAVLPQQFPAILWRARQEPSELQRAFGAVCVSRTDSVEALVASDIEFLVFNAPGRDDLHLERQHEGWQERRRRWLQSRDPALCRRDPCLAAAGTLERLRAKLGESLASRGGDAGLGISLGDEVGLTPGGVPEDVCTCEACEREWSVAHGRETRPELPSLRDIGTDATLRAVFEGELAPSALWLARREFHQTQMLSVLGQLAQLVRAKGKPVGLLGMSGQSAFGGVAVERILPALDFLECYRVGNARDLAFTLRGPQQRVFLTVFANDGPSGTAWSVWEHWMHGGDGVFVWSEEDLERAAADSASLLATLARVRALPPHRPRPTGIAIAHSGRAVAAGWLRDALVDGATWPQRFPSWQERHGRVERARARWFDFARCAGAMPGALPIESLAPGDAARFPLLVLSELLVLSSDDLARLAAYRRAGGTLVIDGEFGWTDGLGHALEGSARRELLEHGPVFEPPAGLELRLGGQPITTEQRAWLVERKVELAPLMPAAEANAAPWLVTWIATNRGARLAFLPSSPASGGTPLRFEPVANCELHWLHPPDASGWSTVLADGEAAVVELARKP
ncbi:MAG: hypothetical protein FJ294_01815 [Planctomycetes bacterium]|nr:hypothetical protein [Planctomycetota bacterium]